MNDKLTTKEDISLEDDLTTPASSPPPAAWTMPEPVFRQTSGKLPQGFEKNYLNPATPESGAETAEASAPAVEAYQAASAPKSPILKIVLVLLGLAAMIAFLIVFLTVLYFFFWRD